MKRLIIIVFILNISNNLCYSQSGYNPKQLFISTVFSLGSTAIANQNNYGFGEMAYGVKLGSQTGVLFGYDKYLKTSLRYGILVSRFGQKYHDKLLGVHHEKEITLDYIQIPVVYKYVFGDTKGFDFDKIFKYIFGGFQLGYLFDANIYWERSGKEIDFWEFTSYKGFNKNLDEIQEIGMPKDDKEFFKKIDLVLVWGLGGQYFLGRRLMVFSELIGNLSIKDINAPTWRFRNNHKSYVESLNLYGGLTIGITYYP